jgi:hypothetical protein
VNGAGRDLSHDRGVWVELHRLPLRCKQVNLDLKAALDLHRDQRPDSISPIRRAKILLRLGVLRGRACCGIGGKEAARPGTCRGAVKCPS